MKLNLSSQIVLNQIPEEFYRPTTAIERSEITRFEKVLLISSQRLKKELSTLLTTLRQTSRRENRKEENTLWA